MPILQSPRNKGHMGPDMSTICAAWPLPCKLSRWYFQHLKGQIVFHSPISPLSWVSGLHWLFGYPNLARLWGLRLEFFTVGKNPYDMKSTFIVILFVCFLLLKTAPAVYGGSQARGLIGAIAASLHHSHSNVGSEPHLRPTPQLMTMLDP